MYKDRVMFISGLEKMMKTDVMIVCNNLRGESSLEYDMVDVVRRIMFTSAKHKNLSIILQTFGGDPSTSYLMIEILREYYEKISIYIVGDCYSAGTIMALQADEIFMGPQACLGPIDGQLYWDSDKKDLWMPSLQSSINTLVKAEEEGKITPFLKKIFEKKMDLLAIYLRCENMDSDMFKEAFNKHCAEDKRDSTWNYITGGVGWHNVPLTYKKACALGLDVKSIPKKLIIPITQLVRDAEKEFGELKVRSPIMDYYDTLESIELASDSVEGIEEEVKKKIGETIKDVISVRHTRIQAIIETSKRGFIGYDLYTIRPSKKNSLELIWLESGWNEEEVPFVPVSDEDASKFRYVIEGLISDRAMADGKSFDELTEEELIQYKTEIENELMEEIAEDYMDTGYPFELLSLTEKRELLVKSVIEEYEELKMISEGKEIIKKMAINKFEISEGQIELLSHVTSKLEEELYKKYEEEFGPMEDGKDELDLRLEFYEYLIKTYKE